MKKKLDQEMINAIVAFAISQKVIEIIEPEIDEIIKEIKQERKMKHDSNNKTKM